MASHRTDASALLDDRGYSGSLVRGQNPALLMEKAVRDRITESYYWKEQCFGLNEASLCDRAVEVTHIGGVAGVSQKPSPFLCLAFKMLQLGPDREVVFEYLQNEDFKYLRALAAFYIRLTFSPVDVYKTLEPFLADYRKLKRRTRAGFNIAYIDQFIDELLTKDRICSTSLWKLPSRQHFEDLDQLDERVSPLGEEIDEIDANEEPPVNGLEETVKRNSGDDDLAVEEGEESESRDGLDKEG